MTPDLSTRYPEVRIADALEELRRERAARARTYPNQIQLGRMTQPEADHQLALIDAIADDVTRYGRFIATRRQEKAGHNFTWHQRRAAIARELDQRARLYPDWIVKGKLDQAEADRAVARLSAVADLFDDGWDWHARNGLRILLGATPTNAAEAQAQDEWRTHYRTVMQSRGYMADDQKELFA